MSKSDEHSTVAAHTLADPRGEANSHSFSEEDVERVARAIFAHMFAPHEWSLWDTELRDKYLELARAALKAASSPAAEQMAKALECLVTDVADYPAWQRPCAALDNARAALSAWRQGRKS